MRHILPFFLVLLLFAMPAQAQEGDDATLYQVSDVAVDVTADSAAHARDQAVMKAQHQAFGQLLARLGADSALEQKLDDDSLAAMVQAFEVQNEKSSAVRYIGAFTVRFKPAAVRAFLDKRGAVIADVRSTPAVVLPVMNTGSRPVLWEERTPWRAAWESAVGKGGLVPIIVPSGDLNDIAMISGAEAVSGKAEALRNLMAKYQASMAIVAVLNADPDKIDPKQPVKIDIHRYDIEGKSSETASMDLAPVADAKALTAAMPESVKQARATIESTSKQVASAPKGSLGHLPASVPIDSLAVWNDIKTKLNGVNGIARTNVVALKRGMADIELEFYGDIPQLQAALAGKSLHLELAPGTNVWMLREGYGDIEQ